MRMRHIFRAVLAGAALVLWLEAADAANPRIALVIGEQTYADAALPTAANDAGLIAQVLQAAGFDVVGARDLDQKSVREALRDFLDKANAAGPDMQAFVYFSGRALQYAGDNYLAPIDAHIARASDAPIEAVKLSDFTHALAAAPGLARVVVIDGARANPYAQQGEPLAGGLALVDPERNAVIAFNAAPGAIGIPETEGYGVYAKTLAGLLRQGGVDIRDVLGQTRVAVNQKTAGAQIPWSAGTLDAPYFLFERAADAPPVAVRRPPAKTPLKSLSAEEAYEVVIDRDTLGDYEAFLRDYPHAQQARRIAAIVAARREALFWRRTLEQNSPRAYWTYLRRYPHGPHAFDADRRLDALAARREPPPDFVVIEYEDLPPPPPAEIIYADRPVYFFGGDDFGPPPPPPPRGYYVEDDDDWRALPPPPPPTIAGILPALAIAIPLGLAARAYSNRPHADGRAPASAPPPAPRPIGPPPLPRGVHAVAAPAPAATPAPTPAIAKPATAAPAATPAAAKPATAVPVATPAPTPAAAKPATAAPVATPAPAPTPAAAKPATAVPVATPSAIKPAAPALVSTPTPSAAKPATPLPKALDAKPALEAPKPAPKVEEPPKPAPEAKPAPKLEPPKPQTPKLEPPRPAPEIKPPPKLEAPKPEPPKPAPRAEAPAPKAAEAPKPAPAPAPAARPVEAPKAACGHPGQPHC